MNESMNEPNQTPAEDQQSETVQAQLKQELQPTLMAEFDRYHRRRQVLRRWHRGLAAAAVIAAILIPGFFPDFFVGDRRGVDEVRKPNDQAIPEQPADDHRDPGDTRAESPTDHIAEPDSPAEGVEQRFSAIDFAYLSDDEARQWLEELGVDWYIVTIEGEQRILRLDNKR